MVRSMYSLNDDSIHSSEGRVTFNPQLRMFWVSSSSDFAVKLGSYLIHCVTELPLSDQSGFFQLSYKNSFSKAERIR